MGRRCNHAYVERLFPCVPNPCDRAFLQRMEQLALDLERQFLHIVQKQRSAMRQFQLARLVARRIRPRPADMAEQFGLNVLGRDRAAFEMDQGTSGTRAGFVDFSGHKRLAGARFARDQHSRIGASHKIDACHDLTDRGRTADDVVMRAFRADRLLQVLVFLLQPVTQCCHLVQSLAQFAFAFLALGDVAEDHHSTRQHLLIIDRGRDIFDADGLAILAPEHLVLDPVDLFKTK